MARTRRTRAEHDAERTERMQRRILDAALASLLELGFARTSTQAVCRRAGVARGTLLHHFPTQSDLMIAALRYVFDKRFEETQARVASIAQDLPDDPGRRLDQVVDVVWAAYQGDSNLAWLEIVQAARTDEALAAALREMMPTYDAWFDMVFQAAFPPPTDPPPPHHRAATKLVSALMAGLVLESIGGMKRDAEPALDLLKTMGRRMLERGWT